MGKLTVDIKFHVISRKHFDLERDGILGNVLLHNAGAITDLQNYTLTFSKFNNAQFPIFNLNAVQPQRRKILALHCFNHASAKSAIFDASALPSNLFALDSLVTVNQGKFLIPVTNMGSKSIDTSNLKLQLELLETPIASPSKLIVRKVVQTNSNELR